mgnify:CR=1 FL=1
MNITPFQDDDEASTLSLLLTIILLSGIAIGGYLFYNYITGSENGSSAGESIGRNIWGFLSGAVSSFYGGAWKDGKSFGSKYNPVTTWRNSPNRTDGKWWTFW